MNSSSNALSTEQFYMYQLLIEIVQLSISICIIVFSVALVYVILHNKCFRTSYGLFLAICCFSDACSATLSFLSFILTILDHKISYLSCLMAQLHGQFGSIFSIKNILFISMERLFAITFPIQYCWKHRKICCIVKLHLVSVLCLLCIFALLIWTRASGNAKSKERYDNNFNQLTPMFVNVRFTDIGYWLQHIQYKILTNILQFSSSVYCNLGDLGANSGTKVTMFIVYLIESVATLIIYSVILIILRVTKRNAGNAESQREQTRRISKSIMVIVCGIFCCYFIGEMGVMFVAPIVSSDPQMQYLLRRAFIQFMVLSGFINAPVLYICSKDYREMMKKEFRIVRWFSENFHQSYQPIIMLLSLFHNIKNHFFNNLMHIFSIYTEVMPGLILLHTFSYTLHHFKTNFINKFILFGISQFRNSQL